MLVSSPTNELLVAGARQIADYLLRGILRDTDKSPSWGRGSDLHTQPFVDVGVFNGRAGEALFFASLYAVTGEARLRTVADEVFDSIATRTHDAAARSTLLRRVGPGLTGVGSLAYALYRAGNWLERPELIELAIALGSTITVDSIDPALPLDIMSGSPTAVLALTTMFPTAGSCVVDNLSALAIGMLERRGHEASSVHPLWLSNDGIPCSGFAHGGTGVAYAALRALRIVDCCDLKQASLDVFDFESTLYMPSAGNWREHPYDDRIPAIAGWCHGAVGIGLTRLEMMSHVDPIQQPLVLVDIDRVGKKIHELQFAGFTNLCCGVAGRIDFLLEMGRQLRRPQQTADAQHMAARVARVLSRRGYNPIDGRDERVPHGPGLWQGAAGIGYVLLRAAFPDMLPSLSTLS